MKRLRKYIVAVLVFVTITAPAHAQKEDTSPPPGVSASAAVLMDLSSKRVLYDKNMHEQRRIASITKIMTALLAIESGSWEDTVTISDRAVRQEGSSLYLRAGDKVKLKDLVYGLMLRSGNDAAVAIAEHVGGSLEGFVFMMNERARLLGMENTSFSNPHGLDMDDAHYSSAYDMGLLTREAMKNDLYRQVQSTSVYRSSDQRYVWKNKNKLLTALYDSSTGGKTGFTKKAGRTLVSTAEKSGEKLLVVTLNAPSDWTDHQALFEWGFTNYDWYVLFDEGQSIKTAGGTEGSKYHATSPYELPLANDETGDVSLHLRGETQDVGYAEVIVGEAMVDLIEVERETPLKKKTFFERWLPFLQQAYGGDADG
ncbi:D-alanyl-D-alanine carboxypeptidase [Bacillaceae bacterium SIJ1]|uniref:D-alanyl-D-alanine carboxypeptidase family protein n=1 Tax=Litoribacterium kuwaitense TaxID=1398745 RepID=UPI0013EAC185|nr:D-alanyl-D-alanine carboxypeptidase family protein [Litoribacterium kuwaitense]NGP43665.1 D-alanyl-D-alanine carboxypeptidase [Litoribacterium kuwaitense]